MGIDTLIGRTIDFEDECEGTITKEKSDAIYIESAYFTGWMFKTEFWDRWGVPGDSD